MREGFCYGSSTKIYNSHNNTYNFGISIWCNHSSSDPDSWRDIDDDNAYPCNDLWILHGNSCLGKTYTEKDI